MTTAVHRNLKMPAKCRYVSVRSSAHHPAVHTAVLQYTAPVITHGRFCEDREHGLCSHGNHRKSWAQPVCSGFKPRPTRTLGTSTTHALLRVNIADLRSLVCTGPMPATRVHALLRQTPQILPACTLGTCTTHTLPRANTANFARVLGSISKCSISSAWPYLLISGPTEGTLPRFTRWAAAFAWVLGRDTVAMSGTPGCPVPAPAPAPVDAWVSCTGEALAPNATDVQCTHTGTGDTWHGGLRGGFPCGPGTYVYGGTKLEVQGTVCSGIDTLKFDGKGSMKWPDGSRFDGDLQDSTFHGDGEFAWANGERYAGAWRGGHRHGRGKLQSWNEVMLQSTAIEGVKSMVYEGEWENNLMHGNGVIEYYGVPEETASKHGRVLRRFRGWFERGFPRNGELQTESEDFAQVIFDGFTPASNFATWYWTPDAESNASGTRLVDLQARGEEFRAALHQAKISMPTLDPYVKSIQRLENDDRRLMYDLQVRHVKNKVEKRPRPTPWTHAMEGWGFHAPVFCQAHA